jgi:hypothetical protein
MNDLETGLVNQKSRLGHSGSLENHHDHEKAALWLHREGQEGNLQILRRLKRLALFPSLKKYLERLHDRHHGRDHDHDFWRLIVLCPEHLHDLRHDRDYQMIAL